MDFRELREAIEEVEIVDGHAHKHRRFGFHLSFHPLFLWSWRWRVIYLTRLTPSPSRYKLINPIFMFWFFFIIYSKNKKKKKMKKDACSNIVLSVWGQCDNDGQFNKFFWNLCFFFFMINYYYGMSSCTLFQSMFLFLFSFFLDKHSCWIRDGVQFLLK